jgi:hypothetical protein
MQQIDVAKAIGRDRAWVSRNLRGPGNWTLRTIGELVEALDGELEIRVYGMEDPLPVKTNYHAYAGYELYPISTVSGAVAQPTAVAAAVDHTAVFMKRAFPIDGSSNASIVPTTAP